MSNEISLYELIRRSFNESELKDFTYDLGIEYEDLPALGKADKARELVKHADQHKIITQLVDALRQVKPQESWPDTARPLTDADLLGVEAKPQLPFEPETVGIPAGPFLMGSDQPNESPQHKVDLDEYWIGVTPVTNAQYAEFIKRTNHPVSKKQGWFGKKPVKQLDHPVVGVSYYDAQAYCSWLSQETGRNYRLPTEAEWEKAARGEDGRLYPWGNTWEAGRANVDSADTTPVTAHPTGASPYDCLDMAGNVWEWTSTIWGSEWQTSEFSYPYDALDGREDLDAPKTANRIFRGGSFAGPPAEARCSSRLFYAPDNADKRRGFRVVLTR